MACARSWSGGGGQRWLREEVVAGHNEFLADPSKGVPGDAILDRIKARRRAERGE